MRTNIGGYAMKTKTINLYTYEEASEDLKENILEKLWDINVDHDWWQYTYDDMENIGLQCNGFDLDRGSYCEVEAIDDIETIAHRIIAEHGKSCRTHQTAKEYLKDRAELVRKYSDGIQLDMVAEDNEYDFDSECNDLDKEFLRSLGEDYRMILQQEYDYLTSKEAIEETLIANEYTFNEDGAIDR